MNKYTAVYSNSYLIKEGKDPIGTALVQNMPTRDNGTGNLDESIGALEDVVGANKSYQEALGKTTTTEHLIRGAGALVGGGLGWWLSGLMHKKPRRMVRALYVLAGAAAGGYGSDALLDITTGSGHEAMKENTLRDRIRASKWLSEQNEETKNKIKDIIDSIHNEPRNPSSFGSAALSALPTSWGSGASNTVSVVGPAIAAYRSGKRNPLPLGFGRRFLHILGIGEGNKGYIARRDAFKGKIDDFIKAKGLSDTSSNRLLASRSIRRSAGRRGAYKSALVSIPLTMLWNAGNYWLGKRF